MLNKAKITDKQIVGQKGEDLGCIFLLKKGFSIKDRNYWKPWGEIDIIAENKGFWHFVEVKTVTRESVSCEIPDQSDQYEPEDNIHPFKLKRLARTIETYLLEKGIDDVNWQIDAVCVFLDYKGKLLKIKFLEDI